MLACLTDGTLKLVSCGYLRSEVATPLPRRQELPEQAFLSPDAAVEAYKAGRVFVLSHMFRRVFRHVCRHEHRHVYIHVFRADVEPM